jgi:hypothetical protein
MSVTGLDPTQKARALAGMLGHAGLSEHNSYVWLVRAIAPRYERSLRILMARNVFLILGTGRIGTTWLAGLLDAVPGARVMHEPVPVEQVAHAEALMHPDRAEPYLRNFRLREMALRVAATDPTIYGEVNSALRRHAEAFRRLAPAIRILHMVRDARSYVPSVMARSRFTQADLIHGEDRPPTAEIAPQWRTMDRFSKVCWMWTQENAYLRRHSDGLLRFEDVTADYGLFTAQVLKPLGIEIDRSLWEEHVRRPLNVTRGPRYAPFAEWPRAQVETFWQLCGEEMARYHYA